MSAMTKTLPDKGIRQIPLAAIKLDQLAQPRADLDRDLVDEYAEAMAAGEQFPPLIVFNDRRTYWLADGFHRHAVALTAGLREVACIINPGGLREAILYSCSANAVHGWRRSNGDKRRAVQTLLADDEWSRWSDREIARHARVSHVFVAKVRADADPILTGNVTSETGESKTEKLTGERTYTTKHGRVVTMDTSKIGKVERAPTSERVAVLPAEPAGQSRADATRIGFEPALATIRRIATELCAISTSAEDIVSACNDQHDRDELVACCGPAGERLLKITSLADRR